MFRRLLRWASFRLRRFWRCMGDRRLPNFDNLQPLVNAAFEAQAELWAYVKDSTDQDLKDKVADAHHTLRDAFDEALNVFEVTEADVRGVAERAPHDKPPTP